MTTITNYKDMPEKFWDNFESWIAYWRKNIHRFIEEYFGIKLHPFQKLILYKMCSPNTKNVTVFDFFASRGLGKTWLSMVFATAMCVLYPGFKVAVASASMGAANVFMKKIEDLRIKHPNIDRELLNVSIKKDDGIITFKNGSMIFSKVCSDRSRGARTQMVIFDERNIMPTHIIETVFLPFLTEKRHIPAYDTKKFSRYKRNEHNYQIYLTSVGYKDDDSFVEFEGFFDEMVKGNMDYSVFAIPYQLGVEAQIIDKSLLVQQAKKQRANIHDFQMEYEAIPFGTNEDAIFSQIEINNARQVVVPLIEPTFSQYIEHNGILREIPGYVRKEQGEIRVMSVDIATAMGRRNDASAWTIFRLFNKGDYFEKVIPFHKAENGANVDAQVLYTKRLWHYFDIDYIVFDAGGAIGIAFGNLLGNVTVDMQLGKSYPGFRTMNRDEKIDIRVTDPNAVEVLYAMVVSGAGATYKIADMSFYGKTNFKRGSVFMLVNEQTAVDELNKRYKYLKLRTSGDYTDKEISDNMISSFANTDWNLLTA